MHPMIKPDHVLNSKRNKDTESDFCVFQLQSVAFIPGSCEILEH